MNVRDLLRTGMPRHSTLIYSEFGESGRYDKLGLSRRDNNSRLIIHL